LVSLLLSSQTKDQITSEAVGKLIQHGLTVTRILQTSEAVIDSMISKVSFHNRKANYLKRVAVVLQEQYDGDIPSTLQELVALPGIGPKMAYLTLDHAWDRTEGIGVDVHVHRISNRLQWVRRPTKEPEDTRRDLQDLIDRDLWREANRLLVGFGQTVCSAVNPKCPECDLRLVCPASTAKRGNKGE